MTGTNKVPDSPQGSSKGEEKSGAALAGIGVQFVVLIVAGMYGGQWVDRQFGFSPWGLVAGVFLGAVLGFVALLRMVRTSAGWKS